MHFVAKNVSFLVLCLYCALSPSIIASTVDDCFPAFTLRDFVQCWSEFMVDEGSLSESDWQASLATQDQIDDWISLIGSLSNSSSGGGVKDHCKYMASMPFDNLRGLYSLKTYMDVNGVEFCVCYETNYTVNGKFVKGWGLFVVPQDGNWTRVNIHYSAAHPITDGPIELQAAEIFTKTNGRSLLIAGTRRDASKVDSECQKGNFRTDAAHNNDSMFHVALTAIYGISNPSTTVKSDSIFIQFHGKATTSCKNDTIFLSTGYSGAAAKVYANPSLPVNRLKVAWEHNAPASWTARTPDESKCSLTATTNVFGRLLNGVQLGMECGTKADPKWASGQFIHAEQAQEARDEDAYDVWTKSILDAFLPQATTPVVATPSSGCWSLHCSTFLCVWTCLVCKILAVLRIPV